MFSKHSLLVARMVMNPSSRTTFTKAFGNFNNVIISGPTLGRFFTVTKLNGVIGIIEVIQVEVVGGTGSATRGRSTNGNGQRW